MPAPTVTPLSWEERASTGFTHRFVIDYADFASGWTTATAYPLITLAAGQGVADAAFRLVTAFDGSGTDLALTVGDGSDVDRFIVSKTVHNDGTAVTSWHEKATTLPHNYTSSDTVDVIFTSTGGTLAALTTGEIHIFLKIVDLNKL